MKKYKLIVLSVMLFYIIFLSFNYNANAIDGECEENDEEDRILFISSYSPSFPTFFSQIEGLYEVFYDECIHMDIEFMDSKRFYDEINYENFYNSLKHKIKNTEKYDLIMVGDDNALDFVMNHEDLFPDQPVVFLGINDIEKANIYLQNDRVAGIYERVSFKGTIDLAKILKPQANKVIAIFDETVTGKAVKKLFYGLSVNDTSMIYEDIDLTELSFEELTEKAKKFTEEDIIIYGSAIKDKNGDILSYKDSAELLLSSTEEPIFCLYDFGVDYGLIGGDVISFFDQGVHAAEMAIDILNESYVTSRSIENINVKTLNYDLLKENDFSLRKLPDDVFLVNKDDSLMKFFLPYLLIILGVILTQTALIVYLRSNIKKRKKIEKDLAKSNKDLLSTNEKLIITNEELIDSNEKIKVALNKIDEQRKEIYELIYIDGLTNIKNRLAITEKINEWLESMSKDFDHKYAIAFIDIDNFKYINDTFGHAFGDKVIIETAERLKTLEDKDVQIGRFGGDEFLVIMRYLDVDEISSYISRIELLFSKSISIENISLYLTISIGISMFPIHGVSCEELIKKADMALYEAKETGRNKAIVYNQKMIEALEDKVYFQSHIRKAFANREFYLNLQPYYDVKKEKYVGAEALIRWRSQELGFVSPKKLIEASEEMGLIVDIGYWVFEESCLMAKELNDNSDEQILVSINISSIQLVHPNFIADIKEIVEKTGVDTEYICLEMTESTLFEFWDDNEYIFDKLNEMGFSIALDDFGTGFSSLSYFKNIPAAVLKIDREFIRNIGNDQFDRFLVEVIINLAHEKGLKVIAEGVEEKDQFEILRRLKCDIIQGYYFSKPISYKDVKKMLQINYNKE